jgi:hypothetical protein
MYYRTMTRGLPGIALLLAMILSCSSQPARSTATSSDAPFDAKKFEDAYAYHHPEDFLAIMQKSDITYNVSYDEKSAEAGTDLREPPSSRDAAAGAPESGASPYLCKTRTADGRENLAILEPTTEIARYYRAAAISSHGRFSATPGSSTATTSVPSTICGRPSS